PIGRHKPIKVVPADPPQNPRESTPNLRHVRAGQTPYDSIAVPLLTLLAALGLQFFIVERTGLHDVSAGQYDREFQNIIERLAVNHRTRTGRVVGDHAADRGAVRG